MAVLTHVFSLIMPVHRLIVSIDLRENASREKFHWSLNVGGEKLDQYVWRAYQAVW